MMMTGYSLLLILPMLLGPAIAGFIGWLTARGQYRMQARTASGSIDTSDARTVWEQNSALIKLLRDEVTRLTAEVARLHELNRQFEAENEELHRQLSLMKADIATLKRQQRVP